MPVYANLEKPVLSLGQRSAARIRLNLRTSGSDSQSESTDVLIHNLSATGLLLEARLALSIGQEINVALPEAGEVTAVVVWTSDDLVGCRFTEPLSQGALSAAQLQNPVVSHEERGGSRLADPPGPASFGEWLRNIRLGLGMSRGELASRTGVSKPTLWAWEKADVAPRRSNLMALSRALDLPEHQVLDWRHAVQQGHVKGPAAEGDALWEASSGRAKGPRLGELISDLKTRVALEAGTDPENVTVTIKF
jgi:transcriptional regulator with XRE-family HTH domain